MIKEQTYHMLMGHILLIELNTKPHVKNQIEQLHLTLSELQR